MFGWLGNLGEIGGKAHGFSDVRNLSYHPHYEFQRWKKEEKVIQESFWSAVPSGPLFVVMAKSRFFSSLHCHQNGVLRFLSTLEVKE